MAKDTGTTGDAIGALGHPEQIRLAIGRLALHCEIRRGRIRYPYEWSVDVLGEAPGLKLKNCVDMCSFWVLVSACKHQITTLKEVRTK